MRSVAPMKAAKIGYLVISGLLCAMGILIILHPETSMHTIGILCGLTLIVFGAIKSSRTGQPVAVQEYLEEVRAEVR